MHACCGMVFVGTHPPTVLRVLVVTRLAAGGPAGTGQSDSRKASHLNE